MANIGRREELYQLFPEEFDLADELHILIQKGFESRTPKFADDDLVKGTICFWGAKSAKTFRAARLLCEQGYGPEAFQMARALSEIYISIRFVKETDSENRSRMFGEYEWVLKKQAWDAVMELAPESIPDHRMPDREIVEREYKRVCETYSHFENPRGALGWTGQGVQKLYRVYGLDTLADIFYPLASQHSHSLPTSAHSYVSRLTTEGGSAAEWRTGPSDDMVKEALGAVIEMEIRILDEVADTLGYDETKAISEIVEKMNKRTEKNMETTSL